MTTSSPLRFCARQIAAIAPIFTLLLSAFSLAPANAAQAKHEAAGKLPRAAHMRTAPQSPARKPGLPFDRVIRPALERRLKNTGKPLSTAKPRPAATTSASSFGGFLAAPKYQAWNTELEDSSQLAVLATGDFNGDGKPDIVTVQTTGSINVRLNQGAGVFGDTLSTAYNAFFYLGGAVQAIAADVNKDNKLDLVLLDWINKSVDVVPGNGDGHFGTPVFYPLGSWDVASMDIADVNGDGYPDVVAVSGGQDFSSGTTSTVEIDTLLNDGHGAFLTPSGSLQQVITLSGWTDTIYGRSLVLTDVNSDGKPDLTLETIAWLDAPTSTQDSTHIIQTFAGNGDGSFAPSFSTTTISIPSLSAEITSLELLASLNLVDVNKDGVKDIVFSLQDYSIYVLLGDGNGVYESPTNVAAYHATPTDLLVADLNGDGLPELIDAEPGYLTVYENLGGGKFDNTAIPSYGSGVGYSAVLATADFSGDGTPDIAFMNSTEDSITIFQAAPGAVPGLQAATLLSPPSSLANGATAQVVLDANGDGKDDVVLYNDSPYTGTPELLTALGDGKGGFVYKSAVTHYSPGGNDFIDQQTGDFNGDGLTDLVLHTSQGVSLLLSNGDGTFTRKSETVLPFACITNKGAIGDVNGDGKLDLVVAYGGDEANPTCESPGINGDTTPSALFTLLGNGDGTFQSPVITAIGREAYEPALVDANGDGKLDVVVSDVPADLLDLGIHATFNTFLLLGDGTGKFTQSATLAAGHINAHTLTGDVNGDGKADLLLLSEGQMDEYGHLDAASAGVLVLAGDGAGAFTPSATLFPGFFSAGGLLTDFNGDGKLDLALQQYSSTDFTDAITGGVVALGDGQGSFTPTRSFEGGNASSLLLSGDFVQDAAPDALYVSGASGTSLLVNQGGTTLTLVVTPPSIYQGQAVDVTAVVEAALTGKPEPTGTITLLESGTTLGSASLSGGEATITLAGLTEGNHTVTAVYSGDSNFNVNTSAILNIPVGPAPSVSVTAVPASLTLSRGQTGTITLKALANASYTGNVIFDVSVIPNGITATFSPARVSLTPGQSADATLIIGTTKPKNSSSGLPFGAGSELSLAAIFLLTIPRRIRKRFSSLTMAVVAALALAGALSLSACGGGSSIVIAPKGSYTLNVTAAPDGLPAQKLAVTVNVQ